MLMPPQPAETTLHLLLDAFRALFDLPIRFCEQETDVQNLVPLSSAPPLRNWLISAMKSHIMAHLAQFVIRRRCLYRSQLWKNGFHTLCTPAVAAITIAIFLTKGFRSKALRDAEAAEAKQKEEKAQKIADADSKFWAAFFISSSTRGHGCASKTLETPMTAV